MNNYTRICARVDLDAIEYNMEMMKKNIKEGVQMISVIKTDGYGHGALQIARMLEGKEYLWGYAVATPDEAVVLRKGGIKKPILVLGCIFPDQRKAMIENEIRMTVYTEEMAKEVSELAGSMGKQAYIHIKLDTGMSRLGFLIEDESVDKIESISRMPNLIMEGMYTHFAKADETDKTFTHSQMDGYLWMKKALDERRVTFKFQQRGDHRRQRGESGSGKSRYLYIRALSFQRSKERKCAAEACDGTDQPCGPCQVGEGGDPCKLRRNLYYQASYQDRDHTGGLWGWIPEKPLQQRLCPDPWKEGSHPWPGMHGSVHGRCDGD